VVEKREKILAKKISLHARVVRSCRRLSPEIEVKEEKLRSKERGSAGGSRCKGKEEDIRKSTC